MLDKRVAILAFHKIGAPPPGGWQTWNYVSEESFVSCLTSVRDLGWTFVDLEAFSRALDDPSELPDRAALLTFDDGYASMLSVAQPLLARFACPSVLFVPTEYVGATNRFDAGNEPEEPICSWDELAALRDRGVSIQSHGVAHDAFSDLSIDEQRSELERSRELLERHLGTTVDAFAFPFGDAGEHAAATERLFSDLGYRTAFLYKGGVCQLPVSNRFAITRVPVGPDTRIEDALGVDGCASS